MTDYGIWSGASVQEVAQVVGATAGVSAVALQIGTLVKLARVALLAPLVFGFALSRGRGRPAGTPLVPGFVIGFLAMAALRTTGILPDRVVVELARIDVLAAGRRHGRARPRPRAGTPARPRRAAARARTRLVARDRARQPRARELGLMSRVALHLSPHPDDEVARACRPTLMALRDEGWRVVNLACGLGRPEQHAAPARGAARRPAGAPASSCCPASRRSRCPRATISPPPRRRSSSCSRRCCPGSRPCVVCAPSPHDGHHAHELVGRAARPRARGAPGRRRRRSGCGGVWADLPFPTLIVPFDRRAAGRDRARARRPRLGARAPAARPADRGACRPRRRRRRGARARQRRLAGDPSLELAELLCEVVLSPAGWQLGAPRRLDAEAPFAPALGPPDRLVARQPSRCTRACAARADFSARRCAARRARSGTRA